MSEHLPTLEEIEWADCLVEGHRDPVIERWARQELGSAGGPVRYLLPVPWVVRASVRMHVLKIELSHVDLGLADLLSLVVGQDNTCRFCYAAARALLRILGHSEEEIRKLEHDLMAAELGPAERAALDFARRLSRSNPLMCARDITKLEQVGYGRDAIRELVFLVGANIYHNRVMTLPAIPSQAYERLPQRWSVRLFRPLIARTLNWRRNRHVDAEGPVRGRDAAFAPLVEALGTLPVARVLGEVIDDCFASPVLSRRCRALVFAVVATSLGCKASGCEATRILRQEGLEGTELEQVLANLYSPRLEPIENTVLPFVRETVRYTAIDIQASARTLREQLDEDEFLDVVGTAALANMVCRMGCLLDEG